MYLHPVIESLKKLKLVGMVEALEAQANLPESSALPFEERLALLLDNELVRRENKRLQTRLKKAKFRQRACLQDLDYRPSRNLDRRLILSLETCQWVVSRKNILISGSTGTGKTFLAEALSHNACMKGYTSHYLPLPAFFDELPLAKADGSFLKRKKELAKYDVLILDDLGLDSLTYEQRRALHGIIDDRLNAKSTIITSQLPVNMWHATIGDDTIADAIMDRIVHAAYRVSLKGESMRKLLNQPDDLSDGLEAPKEEQPE